MAELQTPRRNDRPHVLHEQRKARRVGEVGPPVSPRGVCARAQFSEDKIDPSTLAVGIAGMSFKLGLADGAPGR